MSETNLTVEERSNNKYVAKCCNQYIDIYAPNIDIAIKRAKQFFNIKD